MSHTDELAPVRQLAYYRLRVATAHVRTTAYHNDLHATHRKEALHSCHRTFSPEGVAEERPETASRTTVDS